MALLDQINAQMKDAMRAKDAARLSTLRSIKSELNKTELDSGKALDAETEQQVLNRLTKQRRESIEQFRAGGREEMAAQEEAELVVLQEFMPEQMSEQEMEATVDRVLADAGPVDKSKFGMVMGKVMGELKSTGKSFDGKAVNEMVRRKVG